MSSIFEPFEKRKLSAKNKALLNEWKEIHEMSKMKEELSYKVLKYNRNDLPVDYEITFKIPSFTGLNREKPVEAEAIQPDEENRDFLFYPEISEMHRMRITIPPNFPQINAKPKGSIVTPIWHPNVVCHGEDNFVGRVCFNEGNLDASVTIVDRIFQVADYLRYKNYLAEDREPYPYDLDVAYWIREIAEPMGWVAPNHGIMFEKLGMEEPGNPEQPATGKPPVEDGGMIILDEEGEEEDEKVFDFEMLENEKENRIIEEDDEIIEL